MSRKFKTNKRRKQKQTVSTPVFILMFAGAFLLAAGIFLGLQRLGGDSGSGIPALAVDQQVIDYGNVKLNTNLSFEIKVTNTGDGTLRFKEEPYIEVLEGC